MDRDRVLDINEIDVLRWMQTQPNSTLRVNPLESWCATCPIARYLNHTKPGAGWSVGGCTARILDDLYEENVVGLPLWCREFIGWIDDRSIIYKDSTYPAIANAYASERDISL